MASWLYSLVLFADHQQHRILVLLFVFSSIPYIWGFNTWNFWLLLFFFSGGYFSQDYRPQTLWVPTQPWVTLSPQDLLPFIPMYTLLTPFHYGLERRKNGCAVCWPINYAFARALLYLNQISKDPLPSPLIKTYGAIFVCMGFSSGTIVSPSSQATRHCSKTSSCGGMGFTLAGLADQPLASENGIWRNISSIKASM